MADIPDTGGAATGTPNPPPATTSQPFTQAQADAMNAAIAGHLGRALPKALETALTPHLAKLAPPAPAAVAADEKDPERQFSELQASHNKLLADLAAQRQHDREVTAHAELKRALSTHVRPELLDVAADHLFHVRKQVQAREDGSVVFNHEQVPHGIVEGVAAWAKTEHAKVFLPPPSAAQQRARVAPARPPQAGPQLGEKPVSQMSKIELAQKTAADIAALQRGT